MQIKHAYLALAIIGTVLPYWQFIAWLAENGFDIPQLFDELASTRISAFAWWDVVISGVVLILAVVVDRKALGARWWWPLPGLLVGVSLALPLYLYVRETARSEQPA